MRTNKTKYFTDVTNLQVDRMDVFYQTNEEGNSIDLHTWVPQCRVVIKVQAYKYGGTGRGDQRGTCPIENTF